MPFIKNGRCKCESFWIEAEVHRVFAVLKPVVWGRIAVMAMLLATTGFVSVEAQAQTRMDERQILSNDIRTALTRAGGGTVLSGEHLGGVSRIKIVDRRGQLQTIVIDHGSPRSRISPLEPEEGRRGRFSRGAPEIQAPIMHGGGRKPRSGDVEN